MHTRTIVRHHTGKTLTQLEVAQKKNKVEARIIRRRQIETLGAQLLRCVYCNERSVLRSWGFLQLWHYDFDQWVPDKTRHCLLKCPKCNEYGRIINHPQQALIVKAFDEYHISPREIFTTFYKKLGDNSIEPDLS